MFYKYKKQIYTVFIVIILFADFIIGKSMNINFNKSTQSKNAKVATASAENINYNTEININGINYSAGITVSNATITSGDSLNVQFTENQNSNVADYKLIAYGANNNVLNSQQISYDPNSKTYTYEIQFDSKADKKVAIKIYPLTSDMKSNSSLNLSSYPYGETDLNMDIIKQNTIDQIEGAGGTSNGQ